MRTLLWAVVAVAGVAGAGRAADEKKTLEVAGLKADVPTGWKEETPSNKMRVAQFKLPRADGDQADAELAVFTFPGGAGSVKQNLDRQLAKFVETGRTDKSEKTKVGTLDATYQDVAGTFKKKESMTATDFKPTADYRQLYVVFEGTDGKQHYMTLLGPKATVEKHKKAFDALLKEFK